MNLLLREYMDLSLAGRFRDDDYGSAYGLRAERAASINADWSYAPSQNFSAHLMGSFEHLERDQRSINDAPAGFGSSDGDAGGVLYPLANRWQLGSEQDSIFAGAGLTWRFLERITLDSSYRLIYVRQRLDYGFASDGALPFFIGTPGRRFPNLRSVDHVLESSLRVQLVEHLAVRVFHRFQRGEVNDFQQQGLPGNPALLNGTPGEGAGVLFLGHKDRNYTAHVVGATLQLRFF